MKRRASFFRDKTAPAILFGVFFALLHWPLLSAPAEASTAVGLLYLFLVWAAMILALFLLRKDDA